MGKSPGRERALSEENILVGNSDPVDVGLTKSAISAEKSRMRLNES